jgi:hypothetical protein
MMPKNSNIQPTISVATSVEVIGKPMAAIPSTTIANPTQNSRREPALTRP